MDMCGLAGTIRNYENKSTDIGLMQSTIAFEQILINAQSRGKHASGYAIISNHGYNLYKRPIKASELILTDIHAELMENHVNNDVYAIIGHTRYATQGSPKVSYNNHPIRAGHIIGTHNGSIWNDAELEEMFDIDERMGTVDSEIFFRLLGDTPLEDFIDCKLPSVNGFISSVWSDVNHPNIVYMLKGNKPLSMVYSKKYDSFFYASLESHLQNVSYLDDVEPIELKQNTLYKINTEGLHIEEFDISFSQIKTIPKFVPRYTYKEILNGRENDKQGKLFN